MIITAASITSLFTGFKKLFQDGLKSAAPQWQKIATLVPSSSKSNTYGWLGKVPFLREWIGDRVLNDISASGYVIQNKHWESTVAVDRNDIDDDNLGVYAPLVTEIGNVVAIHPDKQVFGLLAAGFGSLCFDGQNFFDTDHPVNADADGQGANTPTSNVTIDGGYVGDPWYLLDTSRAIKPLIYQQRKPPVFTSMTKPDDEGVFMSNEYRFGVDCRDNVGFSFWQMAHGAKIALTYDNLWTAYQAMTTLKADGGQALGMKATILVVAPTDEKAARELVENERLANGGSNALYKKFEILVGDYL